MYDCDALIIGAGHNALTCAGYLARAGYRVIVLERRHRAGGAVVTEEVVPGYRFDLGGSAHILIHHTPVVADLQLERYGLHYLDCDPIMFHPFPDGSSITVHRDVDRTCQSIAAFSPEDAERYQRFVREWSPIAELMVETFNHAPTVWNLFRKMGWPARFPGGQLLGNRQIFRPYGEVVRELFVSEQVRALVGWMAAQSGPPPGEPVTGPFALWHPMYHVSGVKRPRGGSGELTQALQRMIEDHGGQVLTGRPVEKILVEHGRAVGARCVGGEELRARVVVSGAHIHTTLGMLDTQDISPLHRKLLGQARVGNGFAMVVRFAVNRLPNYLAAPSPADGSPGQHHRGLQFVCPSLDYLERAYGDYLGGRPSREPGLVVMTFSAVDPSLAPPGKHVMFIWGQYHPFRLSDGETWPAIQQRERDRLLDTLEAYAPGIRSEIVGELIESPLYLQEELGLPCGNVMHLEMSIDQMFFMRPALGLSRYRGPVKGLYLTGASTHPGGGIMAAAGRNAAKAVLRDLSAPWRWLKRL